MASNTSLFLKALGLQRSPNRLSDQPGSLLDASNVIIRRDNIIEPRRGFKLFGMPFGSSSDRAKQLLSYKNRLLRHYSNILQFETDRIDNVTGLTIFDTFFGVFDEVDPGLRIKGIESNGNFYITTANGIQKISAVNGNDFSTAPGYVSNAGGIQALDLHARLKITNGSTTGFFLEDGVVAYRVVWGTVDANNNLVLGAPSPRVQITNPILNLILNDYNIVLTAMDNVASNPDSLYTIQNFESSLGLPNTASASQTLTNLIALSSKLDQDPGPLFTSGQIVSANIVNGICTIILNDNIALLGKVQVGDEIYLNGFNATSGTLNGVQTITQLTTTPGAQEVTPITFTAETGTNYAGKYFTLNSANDIHQYYIWYQVSGTGNDPQVPGKIGIPITISSGSTGAAIAASTSAVLNTFGTDFSTGAVGALLTITNVNIGQTTDATIGTLGGTISIGAITPANSSSIVFNTTATGPVTLVSPNIESGWFRSITPAAYPAAEIGNHDELIAIQAYLQNILTELQSNRNLKNVANENQIALQYPLKILSSAVSTGTTLTITFDVTSSNTDARNEFVVGNKIELNGLWNTSAPVTSLSGYHVINTVTNNTITITIPSSTNGAVSINTTTSIDKITRFSNNLQSLYITPIAITTTATVLLDITVPPDATLNTFFQIYRTAVLQATGATFLSDLNAGDEMRLVYEAYPTQAQLDAKLITIEDVVLEGFREGGANLYTNEQTGEGILQANGIPPLAKDINRFKNVIFYANTQTRQRQFLSLLGVQNLISEFNAGRTPMLTISTADGSSSSTYSFVPGTAEVTPITFSAETGVNYTGKYFTINSADDFNRYYVWYQVSGAGSDPMPAGLTGVQVLIHSGDNGTTIAAKTTSALSALIRDFSVNSTSATMTITNLNVGYTTDATTGTLGAAITIGSITQGTGELAAKETTNITTTAPAGLGGKYFTLNSAFDKELYYIWYTVDGSGSDPLISGRIGIMVPVLSTDTSTQVASKTVSTVNTAITTIIMTSLTNVITATNFRYGPAGDATAGTSGFTILITQQGALNVLLSTAVSPAQAVDITSQSLIRIINQNQTEAVSGFYLSSSSSTPGQMLFEARQLSTGPVYFLMNGTIAGVQVGNSFSPNLAPTKFITNISASNPTIITSVNHGLTDQQQIIISNSNSVPSINGVYTITRIDNNTFSIPVDVIISGNQGGFTSLTDLNNIVASTDEVSPNRIYYSKIQQPESVPITNFLDVGAKDKAILRIFPLRDSLMIFKEDGLFRLSGEVAPWTVALLDVSAVLVAPDSISATNNFIFGWTTQGIVNVTESGVSIISRPIDIDILPKNTPQYTNFKTATWGVGYNSDNTYVVFTTKNISDTEATIGYIFNNLTSSWTTYDKTTTCGIINPADDRLYMGAGDTNSLEQERKNFNRLDYSDREIPSNLTSGNYLNNGLNLVLPTVNQFKMGDVIVQEQFLTIYDFNQLLKKLDLDPGLSSNNYFTTLQASAGIDLRNILANENPSIGLAAKLVADTNTQDKSYLNKIRTQSGALASNSSATATVLSLPKQTFFPADVNTGTDTITITSNGYASGQLVRFTTTGTLPGGLALNTDYYIINPTLNTFQVSLSFNGSAVNLTSQGTGIHTSNSAHGLVNGRLVEITGITGSNPDINGGGYIVTVIDPFTFSIPVNIITGGTGGSYSTLDQSFQDIRASYNEIINTLNLDPGVSFSNYNLNVNTSIAEAIIESINQASRTVTLNIGLQFVVGPLVIFQSIISSISYSPLSFGDPVHYKQINTCHALFEDQTFTNAVISFSTDLLPVFTDINFTGQGNGLFGYNPFGSGFFGGQGNSQPFRTYIPRNAQRCTFMNVKFIHRVAREKFSLNGIALSGNIGLSERSYR